MLQELTIQRLAIIDECHLHFAKGLTVFTGETGAGKSMIVDALSLLLGKSAQEDMISDDSDVAYVEGIFSFEKGHFPLLEDYVGEDEMLILSRRLQRGKSSVARINGQALPLKKYKAAVADLLTIAGQHDYMTLLHSDQQRLYLDHFFGAALTAYQREYGLYQHVLSEFSKLSQTESNQDSRKEFLKFQIDDIESQKFQLDEEDVLQSQKVMLKQVTGLMTSLAQLNDGFQTISDVSSGMTSAAEMLHKVNEKYAGLRNRVAAIDLEVNDVFSDIQSFQEDAEMLDASSLDEIEARLDVIFRYKSKYHVQSLSELLDLCGQFALELKSLDSHGERLLSLQSELADIKVSLTGLAKDLSDQRHKAAKALSKNIQKEMTSLKFEVCQFDIRIETDLAVFGPYGCDVVTFFVSTNAGSTLKLLSEVASGGELSRIMLAIRSVFSDRFLNRTAVFDEIDAGVGGLTAVKIGEKLHALSEKAQIFCVTHLAQIAKFADHHIVVSKSTRKGKTTTSTHTLQAQERRDELKRMVGGEDIASLIRS